jgi:hypothetical protein
MSPVDPLPQYNPKIDKWSEASPLGSRRENHGVALHGGRLIAAGGYDSMWGEVMGSCEGLDLCGGGGHVWEKGCEMLSARRNCALVSMGGEHVRKDAPPQASGSQSMLLTRRVPFSLHARCPSSGNQKPSFNSNQVVRRHHVTYLPEPSTCIILLMSSTAGDLLAIGGARDAADGSATVERMRDGRCAQTLNPKP